MKVINVKKPYPVHIKGPVRGKQSWLHWYKENLTKLALRRPLRESARCLGHAARGHALPHPVEPATWMDSTYAARTS